MNDILLAIYPWIKALHIMAVISWMAGIFYLPRLFVHHAEKAVVGSETSEIFKMMERKLLKVIMNPAMIVTWLCGLLILVTPGVLDLWSFNWIHVKLIAVLGMTWFHHWLGKRLKEFAADANTRSGRTYRIANEVPTVLMIVIVVLVIVRPF